jgi:hypothetical protein
MVKTDPKFIHWQRSYATGKLSAPIQLCLLGTLRYLGRGWTFDDLEESTSVNKETHCRIFHCFIYCGSTVLYETIVKYPTTEIECKAYCREMDAAGYLGYAGSTDAHHHHQ